MTVADYQGKETTEAFLLRDRYPDDELIVVAFRGTEFFDAYAWSTDLDISWYKYVGVGKSLAYYTLKDRLLGLVKDNSNAKFIVTGHSLGGALSILFVAILAFYKEDLLLERLRGVSTFGQPRVGDEEFIKSIIRGSFIATIWFLGYHLIVLHFPTSILGPVSTITASTKKRYMKESYQTRISFPVQK
ncbi:hypothetical protein ACLB2K_001318 [Fragaria x ananassa]